MGVEEVLATTRVLDMDMDLECMLAALLWDLIVEDLDLLSVSTASSNPINSSLTSSHSSNLDHSLHKINNRSSPTFTLLSLNNNSRAILATHVATMALDTNPGRNTSFFVPFSPLQ